MKISKSFCTALVVTLSASRLVTAAPATEAIQDYSGSLNGYSNGGPSGYTFKPLTDISISSLGAFDYLFGQNNNDNFMVGVWSSTGTLMASTTVTSTSTETGQTRYVSITPVILTAGQFYVAAVFDPNGPFLSTAFAPGGDSTDFVTVADGLQFGGSALSAGPGFVFPTPFSTSNGAGAAGANFLFSPVVPEPTTLSLLGLAAGACIACGIFRRSSR